MQNIYRWKNEKGSYIMTHNGGFILPQQYFKKNWEEEN